MAAVVVVMGDIGRSPRMMNHAAMLLSRTSLDVHILAYRGALHTETPMYYELESSPRVHFHAISPPALKALSTRFFLLYALIRVLCQTLQIACALVAVRNVKVAIVQNPPAIPALAIVVLNALLRNFQVFLDWHNYGYTLLQIAGRRRAVTPARLYEKYVGALSDHHFCVSNAMRDDLQSRFSISYHPHSAHTLYDRPPSRFRTLSPSERLSFRAKYELAPDAFVLISCTSWTPDEHFDLLYTALALLDTQLNSPVTFLITGKGPLRDHYAALISKRRWNYITIRLLWVPTEDYPLLLAACDIGVSLHASSSGFDLPMKVVDMMGAGLPVLSLYYPTVKELIRDGENGEFFIDENSFVGVVTVLMQDAERRARYRSAMESLSTRRWEDEWTTVVLPLLTKPRATSTLHLGLAVWIVRACAALLIYTLVRFFAN